MSVKTRVTGFANELAADQIPASEPCVMVIFGASGDLAKRLLVPALYNLACDGLLADNFAVLGTGRSQLNNEEFRASMAGEENGLRAFHTRKEFDEEVCNDLVARFYFEPSNLELDDFIKLKQIVDQLDEKYQANGNVLFYLAMAPRFFSQLCELIYQAGFQQCKGWKRIIVEKPFGTDLPSARALNKDILKYWDESQIYRIDHYLGKETVQNLLAFRFSNGMFEPLWNNKYIDNIQFNVCEAVDVGARGGYYDSAGVFRDMMQNHMFQMLAYLCMEAPGSFEPDSIRNEKAKLLESVRIYRPDEVPDVAVRGQYGPSLDENGNVIKPGYRHETDVNPESSTETFAAIKLSIDNWRWSGVPIYLRSGKALWKRGTEIVVEFKRAPEKIFRGTSIKYLGANRLIFHIQPFQGIELLFQAKTPGPTMQLQTVDMVFNYGDAFKASRYTGYEVMLYSCTRGDATLFSRGDLVEAAWRIAQPMLDYWGSTPAPDFPNYTRNSWGPKAAYKLLEKDHRRWFEVVTPDVLENSPIFQNADPVLLNAVILALRPVTAERGEMIVRKGDIANELYYICRGEVEVIDGKGNVIRTLKDGGFFGDVGVFVTSTRSASVRAKTLCDLFVFLKSDFRRILQDHPQFAENMLKVATERYHLTVSAEQLIAGE